MNFRLPLLAMLASAGFAFSQQQSSEENKNAIYFHPLTLITTAAVSELPLYVNITYERELDNGRSLIIDPGLWIGSFGSGTDLTWITAQAGLRKYLNGTECHGGYLQGSAFYRHIKESFSDGVSVSENSGGLIGYVGTRGKWPSGITMFIDAGLGYEFASATGSYSGSSSNDVTASGGGLAYDVNFGVGFDF